VLIPGFTSFAGAQGEPQEPPISTDRPGFLFAPTVVPEGRFQVEAGLPTYTKFSDSGDELRAWSWPVALRYGLTDTFELRASLPTWNDVRVESGPDTARDEGFGDVEVGAKLALPPLADGPLAVLGSLRLPTGAEDFTTDEVGASAFLLHGRNLSDVYWLQTMAGLTYLPVEDAPDSTNASLAALVSRPIAERWTAFVEATALPGLNHFAGQAYLGAALIWLPLDNLQLDLSADFGLDDDSADVIAAFGVSFFL
jgi:hypothetical protein